MDKLFYAHILGVIYWIPSHKPEGIKFPSATNFRTLARFTSDFSIVTDAVVNFSPFLLDNNKTNYRVRLCLPFFENKEDDIKQFSKNSEMLLMDAYKVIAICRNISMVDLKTIKIDDPWFE